MTSIVAERDIVVGRPVAAVRAQFADMDHHESSGVHSALHVSNVRPQPGGGCRFTGRRRLLGMLQEDEIELTPHPDGHLTLRSIAGANAGLVITQYFEALGPDRTRVRASVDLPVRGALRWLTPLVRLGLQRDLATALQEDCADLERGAYARRLSAGQRSPEPVGAS